MAIIEKKDKKVIVDDKSIEFKYSVDVLIVFENIFVVLLMDDDVPENNIIAYNMKCERLWDISDIIQLTYKESYISLSKESDDCMSVISYNGLKSFIDVNKMKIISKVITK